MTEAFITEELRKMQKVGARKKLYYSIARMFHDARDQVRTHAEALKAAAEQMERLKEEGDDEQVKTMAKIMSAGTSALGIHILNVHRLNDALLEYRRAFGEYPEFTRFFERGCDEARLEKLLGQGANMLQKYQEMLNDLSKKAKVTDKTPKMLELAFGEDFVDCCEKIKLKGE